MRGQSPHVASLSEVNAIGAKGLRGQSPYGDCPRWFTLP